jgi:LuxR family maltose regulon positive regulatory protein
MKGAVHQRTLDSQPIQADGPRRRPAATLRPIDGPAGDLDEEGQARSRRERAEGGQTGAKPRAEPPWSPPRVADGTVPRPRLVRQLLEERQASAAFVCAPPGYGKTSLLAEWTGRDERPCAWITAERRHGHAPVLLEAVVEALDALEPVDERLLGRCRQAAREGGAESSPELLGAVAETVVAAQGRDRAPAVLVLDDAHVVRSRGAIRVLSALAAAVPAGSKLVLASRARPALQLGRLRAQHGVLEIGTRDLALTAYEAHRQLRREGLHLDRADLERLVAATEGWPAALYLAALSLRSCADRQAAVQRFNGSERTVAEYVRQEVLDPLPAESREFLRRCSVADQLSVQLCDVTLERSDSAVLLEALAFRDLVLLPLDNSNTWYRCHPLVREALRDELDASDPEAVAALSIRASRWFEQHDDLDRAIDQAVAAGAAQRTGELLWNRAPACLGRGADSRVERWLSALGPEQTARSPRLAICAALSSMFATDAAAAERWARSAAGAAARQTAGAARGLAGAMALLEATNAAASMQAMGTAAAEAETLLDADSPWLSLAFLLEGVTCHVAGDRAAAQAKLEAGVRSGAAVMPLVEALCLAQLTMVAADDDDWVRADDHCEAARRLVESHSLADEPLATLVYGVSAWIAGRRGRVDQAKRDVIHAMHALDQHDGFMAWFEVEARILVARASTRLADVVAARASLSHASRALRRISDAPAFHSWLDDEWAEIDERSASALAGPAALTIAELRILRFLPTHLSFREIGERLEVSTNTVKTQAHAVYSKLGAASRSDAVARASALGLIEAAIV